MSSQASKVSAATSRAGREVTKQRKCSSGRLRWPARTMVDFSSRTRGEGGGKTTQRRHRTHHLEEFLFREVSSHRRVAQLLQRDVDEVCRRVEEGVHGEAAQLQQVGEEGEDAAAERRVRVLQRQRQKKRQKATLGGTVGGEAVERGQRAGEERVGESDDDRLFQGKRDCE